MYLFRSVDVGNTSDMEKPKPGCGSTKALGKYAPAPKQNQKIEGIVVPDSEVTVPCGKIADTGISSSCSHNEYIVSLLASFVHDAYCNRSTMFLKLQSATC
jgi:hypothetical protein